MRYRTFHAAKIITAQLICIFVFAHAKSRFSHNEAQMDLIHMGPFKRVFDWPLSDMNYDIENLIISARRDRGYREGPQ